MNQKKPYSPVSPKPDFFKLEDKILKFWKSKFIFEKSINQRSKSNLYSFYDGPPFVTGVPHYGSLLSSIAKDIVPRYWTMKGKRVRRIWGWDCHGLPIENKVENKLKLKNKKDIEKIGLKKFIKECRRYVSSTSSEWEWYIDHIGRWVNFKNAYKTMDKDYMETVLWVFKEIYKKGLIYQGKRVSLFCPRCSTPVSNFEIAMDSSYLTITEPSNIYKYQLKEKPNTFILAWSTTPWNKIVTPALAVNPKLTYVKVKQGSQFYILAKNTLKRLKGKYKIIETFKGSRLNGISFVPHYDFYKVAGKITAYKVYCASFVTADDGTGVVTIAAYGEDDYKLMKEKKIPILEHINQVGIIKPEITKWAGIYYLKVNPLVNKDLSQRGLLYSQENYTHSVPVCWRCKTRLIFAPQKAWFIKVSALKKKMLETNKKINWVPKHFKYGRFKKGIENAPDWCISRSRYWGTPMPVWDCQCGARYVIGSVSELEKLSGQIVDDFHRPNIDKVVIKCRQCGKQAKRIPDVLDSWIEAGSMPYAQRHYPFEHQSEFKKSFPGDFVSEYVAQTRAWFYVMHVISNALFANHCFKNVVVTGVIMGTDGRKMSKSYGNYPNPQKSIQKYGGDSLRLYLLGSRLMIGKDIDIAEKGMVEAVKNILLPLWNSYRYFISYANLHQFKPQGKFEPTVLDKWILARLKKLGHQITTLMDNYQITFAVRLIQPFIDDLSTWYIRRSRQRFVKGDKNALETLYKVLLNFTKFTAPVIPFITERIYLNLTGGQDKESVHLCNYPTLPKLKKQEEVLFQHMQDVREICNLGNAQRRNAQIKIRQPLSTLEVFSKKEKLPASLIRLIKDELNIKKVQWLKTKSKSLNLKLDTLITPKLKREGEAREIIRSIQAARKKAGYKLNQKVTVILPSWPKEHELEICQKTLAKKLVTGKNLKVLPSTS